VAGLSFDGISITVGNLTVDLDDSFDFESLDISLGAVELSVDSDGEVDYNISINGVSIVGSDAEFEVSDSIGPPSANITIGAKPSDKDIDITINIAAISARFSVQLPDSTSKSGNNPSLEAENPNLLGIPFGELGLYGNNSDSDSSTSNGNVGQSIGLDAFGGLGEDVSAIGDPRDFGGGGPDGGDPGGGFGGKPIVLDLDNDGLELVVLEEPTAFFDLDGDGYRERAAWVSADDGLLADDKDGDGAITDHDELSFVGYVEGAQTDLEGLSHFDTNGNGELDPGDTDWSKFRVWQDLNRDGESDPGELRTLTEAGISSIPLTGDGVERRAIAA